MTSSNGSISALLAICAGNSPVPGEFSAQRPAERSFDVFLDLRLKKRLSKPSWGWWFETPSRSLWHHCNKRPGHCRYLQMNFLSSNIESNFTDICFLGPNWQMWYQRFWPGKSVNKLRINCNGHCELACDDILLGYYYNTVKQNPAYLWWQYIAEI